MSDIPNHPLEPISTLFTLATIPYHGTKPKVGVVDGLMLITPSETGANKYYQSIVRRYNNIGREDISQLFEVILQIKYWYLTDNSWYSQYPDFLNLLRYAINGLKILQTTYRDGTVVYCIQHFVNLIDKIINNEEIDKRVYSCLKKVDLYDFINTLPKKIYTKIGEGGIKLSGGQKQRLTLSKIFFFIKI